MRTIKYKHICPEHGIETCHCVNGNTSQKHNLTRFRGIHFCTLEEDEFSWRHDPPRFASERFMKDELNSMLKTAGRSRTAERATETSNRRKHTRRHIGLSQRKLHP